MVWRNANATWSIGSTDLKTSLLERTFHRLAFIFVISNRSSLKRSRRSSPANFVSNKWAFSFEEDEKSARFFSLRNLSIIRNALEQTIWNIILGKEWREELKIKRFPRGRKNLLYRSRIRKLFWKSGQIGYRDFARDEDASPKLASFQGSPNNRSFVSDRSFAERKLWKRNIGTSESCLGPTIWKSFFFFLLFWSRRSRWKKLERRRKKLNEFNDTVYYYK